MALPVQVCLKSEYNNKYLSYLNNVQQENGLLQFSGENLFDPAAQFEVVQAKTGGGLIHLKSRFTNKYFVRWSPNHYWITPAADEPNENEKEWSCTLFKPTILKDSGNTLNARFMHVQLGHYVSLYLLGFKFCLFAEKSTQASNSTDIITVLDYSFFSKLPQNVTFKGDNGKYLGAFPFNGKSYLQFSFDNPNDPKAAFEVFSSLDGTVNIKSKYFDKFWRLDEEDMIVADATKPDEFKPIARAMFRPKFIDDKVVAVLNMQKTWYAKRYTSKYGVDLLSVSTSSVDDFAKLQFQDLDLRKPN